MSSSRKGRPGRRFLLLFFSVVLLSRLSPAADIPYLWTGIDRVVAVADLHGDYDRFVFILTQPGVGVLDEELHWIAGKTHLVQLGDIMDRGDYAKEIFDLLIRLEKEAEAVGGMVHVLLGNHEEMNITGISLDYPKYVTVKQFVDFLPDPYRKSKEAEYLKTLSPQERKKAEANALDVATDENLTAFWQKILDRKDPEDRKAYVLGFNNTYGDWLLQKNVIIKIDDVIFVHGGVSEAFSKWPLREINTVMRTELELFQGRMRDPRRYPRPFRPKLVYNSDGPLWFRGQATERRSAQSEVDRILANLGARAMVIGHNFFSFPVGSPVVGKDQVARFHDKVWMMDSGISGSYGGVPSALIYDKGDFKVWGETQELAARTTVKLPPPVALAPKDMEDFLRTASVVGRGPGPGGRTDAWRLTLEAGGAMRTALFRYIDRRRPDPLADSYKYDLAAYALDKYLVLGYVPPIVAYQVDKTPGALQAFVTNSISEAARKEQNIVPKDPEAFERSMIDLKVFQNLVYDDCQNEKDTLVSRDDGKIFRVDFSEAFAPKRVTVPRCDIRKCSRLLYKKLNGWDDKTVAGLMAPYLNAEEIRALNVRRELIVRHIQKLIEVAGEANVLF
ncbi:MAG TPA: metallophosphoesterase [Candidatus Latescibacteria bacterium]|nr:metallophosphoesterase [Candidatus Latescibacterota bacterium]